jgi:hypothetical protein
MAAAQRKNRNNGAAAAQFLGAILNVEVNFVKGSRK